MSLLYKKIRRILPLVLIFCSIVLLQKGGALQPTEQYVQKVQPGLYAVTQVVDGDTIVVDMNGVKEKIRLIGVDTPETNDPRKDVQCFGKEASNFTRRKIGTNSVRLEADPTNTNRDRYQRLLRYVYLTDGTLINAEIIKQGYGFAYTYFPFTKLEEFRLLQKEAERENRGLWSTCTIETEDNGRQSTDTL